MLLCIVKTGLVKGWRGLCQTPGEVVRILPADISQNRWLNVRLIRAFKHLLTFWLTFRGRRRGKLNVMCSEAFFHTCACEEDKAFIKDWEYGHDSHIILPQTSWSYSAWMWTSLEGLSVGSGLADHPSALFTCNFALFVILNYIWEKSIVSPALK